METPRTLVVIPTLNEGRNIASTLTALLDSSAPPGVHVIVADGGSTDDTRAKVLAFACEHPNVEFMDNPKRHQSAGINAAVRRHGHESATLIRADAHALYPPRYLADLVQALEVHAADSVVVTMDSIGTTCVQRAIAWVSDTSVGSGGSAHRGGRRSGFVDHGHHAAFKMSAFSAIGGYDEAQTHNEDAEFDCRLRKNGGRIYLDSAIRIGYFPRGTLVALWHQYRAYGFGRATTIRRHPESARLRQAVIPLNLAGWVVSAALLPGHPIGLVWPAFYFGALATTSLAAVVRMRSVCGFFAGAAAFVMHTAWAVGFVSSMASGPFAKADQRPALRD